MDYGVFLVTNQAGIAEGLISERDSTSINNALLRMLALNGINILKTYCCPHGEGSTCDCRKPKPTMILQAARECKVDLPASWTVGDTDRLMFKPVSPPARKLSWSKVA